MTYDSATKDRPRWGFTVKQGVTTIHKVGAACVVSTSSLTMEVEAVTHALSWIASRGDSQTTLAIILADSVIMSLLEWNGKPRQECVNGRHPPLKLLWMFSSGQNDQQFDLGPST